MVKYLLSLSLLLSAGFAAAQGWERVYDGGGQGQINDIALAPDGGYVMAGYYNQISRARIFKADADGFLQWTKDFFLGTQTTAEAVIVTKDGNYVIAGYCRTGAGAKQAFLLKTDKSGNLLWSQKYNSTYDAEARDIVELPDGSLAVCGYQNPVMNVPEDLMVFKTDANGSLIWLKTYGEPSVQEKGNSLALASNGDLVVAGEKGSGKRDMYVVRVSNTTGSLVWENMFGFFEVASGNPSDDAARDVICTSDGNIVLAGRTTIDQGGNAILMKIDGAGTSTKLWYNYTDFTNSEFFGLSKAADGGFFATGNKASSGAQEDVYIVRTDAQGKKLCEISVGRSGFDQGFAAVATPDGGVAAAGTGDFFVGSLTESNPYLVKADKNCLVFTSYVNGHIFHDFNANCKLDANEPGLEDWIVKIESPNFTRYAAANANGDFQLLVDTGTYKIQLFPPNDAWKSCSQVITLPVTSFSDTFPISIPVNASFACPRNEVDVATPILRRCSNNTYTVRYCNSGTIPSLNTQVEVTLDPYLLFVGSSVPVLSQQDNTYIFNVGYLANGDCGSFTVDAFLDCANTVTGQAHCVRAHIFPDTFCNVQNWDHSIVAASAKCENDSVKLSLKNVGAEDMNNSVGFVIAEDVLMLTAPNDPEYQVKLKQDQDTVVFTTPATGKTYRVIAHQSPGYPGISYPTAAIEGCKNPDSSSYSIGFYTMFPEDDAEAFKASDCQESYDTDFNPPYLKRGHPKGYDVENYIQPESDLEFLIQFQNSGTDTVHQVIVRDTLSPFLDPATVHPGAASHAYDFDVYGNGIVQFTLPNLNLPPGSSASEGYVKFRVSQKPALPCKTKIFNSAAIYFDFNAPVLTNQTFHTVCLIDTFAVVQTKNIEFEGADVQVYPNPFDDSAIFEISGVSASGYTLELFDMLGKKVFNQSFNHPTFRLYRHHLPAGMFFYRLTTEKGKPVASGKLLVR